MNITASAKIARAITTVSCLIIPIFSQVSWAQSTLEKNPKTDGVSFYCDEITDKETGKKVPATVAYVPQKQGSIPIIAWTSEHLIAWNPQRRCEEVSPKFQTFYQTGRLNYFTNGESNDEEIICGIPNIQEPCNGESQLFQLRPGSSSEDVIAGLEDLVAGKVSTPIYQNSGGRTYISVFEFLDNAPVIQD